MSQVKVSVSLSAQDIETIDNYAKTAGLPSRSAAIQRAIRLLEAPHLDAAYEAAWAEWDASGEAAAWAVTDSDGLGDAAR